MREYKVEKGITLIALIVTIIILLILAGVAIITLTGENSLLKRANEAKEKISEAEAIEIIQLELISCKTEYILNEDMDLVAYVNSSNKDIEVEADSTNTDNNPIGKWTMTYGKYIFHIDNLQIDEYEKVGGTKPTATIRNSNDYKFASIAGSSVQVEIDVNIPQELAGATVTVTGKATSGETGIISGNYDAAVSKYTGIIETDGTINTNGNYIYEIKATKDGKDYTINKVVNIENFLDNPQIEIPENDKTDTELKIKVTNNYPANANISYKYYISETTAFGTGNFTTDKEIIKTGLHAGIQYNIKVEAYLSDQITKVESYSKSLLLARPYTINDINFYSFLCAYPISSKNGPEKAETLFDGIEVQGGYGGNMFCRPYNGDEITFSVNRSMTIEAYGKNYSDNGGTTAGRTLILSKYDQDAGNYNEYDRVSIKENEWYEIATFSPGNYYKIQFDDNYVVFGEWRTK